MNFKELVSPSLKELFIKEIKTMILSGDLKIGEKLPPEREIADKMKVSQSVVNSGISELESKGYVKVIPRKGTYVADYKHSGKLEVLQDIFEYSGGSFDPEVVESLFEIRKCINLNSFSAAAERASEEDIAKIKSKLSNLELKENQKQPVKFIIEFYGEIHNASKNIIYPIIFSTYEFIYQMFLKIINKHGFSSEELLLFKKLVDSIEQKNPKETATCVDDIITWEKSMFDRNL